jgi:penicillin-binding protein A
MNFSFIATLVFLVGLTVLLLALLLAAWRSARKAARLAAAGGAAADKPGLPEDFGPRLTSNRLRLVRWAFALLVVAAFGFHVYWGMFAAGPVKEDEEFAQLKNRRDQRNRRDLEANLRGWMFDRHRDIRRTLAKYRYLDGRIIRDYPLGPAAAHLVGYSGLARGDAGLERAVVAQPPPKGQEKSLWDKLVARVTFADEEEQTIVAGRDLVLTIDYDLQKEAFNQLQGQRGAVVMINPQTGEVLALASAPSFDPDDIENNVRWQEISADVKNRPLLNRALDEYYLPGSTLKTLTAAAALDARQDGHTFFCQGGGWTPPGSGRAIRDDSGHAHGRIGLLEAYTLSCNQYFAQLGVAVERERMGEAAARFGMYVFADPLKSIGAGQAANLWNTENKVLSAVLAPLKSTFVSGRQITKYDLALESIGQGYVQLTPFEMALVAAAPANLNGNVMRPKIEMDRQPAALSQAMTPQTAARVRELMASVVERGTASGGFASIIRPAGITAGGKTGTAQREVPVINPQTGEAVTYKDSRGRTRVKKEHRIDSWFIGFAPVNNPQIAFAVVVEAGGYGSKTSAPIAANLLVKAKSAGLLGAAAPPPESATNRPRR